MSAQDSIVNGQTTANHFVNEEGNAKNVIIMIGDGMGWEMARAAAIAN